MRHEIGDRAGSVDFLEALAGLAIREAGPLVPARLFGAAERSVQVWVIPGRASRRRVTRLTWPHCAKP